MTSLREAARQALEAWDQPHGINYVDFRPYMDALKAALEERAQEPDLSRCPRCGGPADNGHDRCVPPNPYHCTKCMEEPGTGGCKSLSITDLQEALVYTGIIDRDAIDDPDEYDEGSTLAQIDELHRIIQKSRH